MKKFLVSSLMIGVSLSLGAQLLSVESIERISTPPNFSVREAVISPDGNAVVVSTNGGQSLSYLDLNTGNVSVLTDNGSMSGLQFSADSRSVIFRQTSFNSNLRYTSIVSHDLSNNQQRTLVKPSREINGFSVVGSNVMTVENRRMRAASLNGTSAVQAPVASIYYGQLMITVNGETKAINPNGKEGRSYLWPSVSPDGTKVVYYLGSNGCYVCNIDGSNPKYIGSIRAPRWMNNEIIVGMEDYDDGTYITSSKIVAANLTGELQSLTGVEFVATYPSASADGSKVVFTTPAGEAYIININR